MNIFNFLFCKEKAVLYSMLGTVWRILFAPVSMLLISLKLTPELQGYYYLFFSMAGMQQIFEVGFSHTLVQSISHEMNKVSFSENKMEGDIAGIFRVEETLKLGFFWFLLLGLICLLLICPIGVFFMKGEEALFCTDWFMPWIVFMVFFSFNLFFYPINFFIEGIQQVEKIYKIRFIIQIISGLFFLIFLLFNLNLFSIIALPLASIIVNFGWLYIPKYKFYNRYIFKLPSRSFVKGILKWQLKVGFVWSSGYLYWQLPTVIIFNFLGPILSGQYSMTANVINSIMNIGQVFVRTKASVIGELKASNNLFSAFKIYKKATQMSYATVLICFLFFFLIWILFPEFQLFNRMLPLTVTFAFSLVFVMVLNTLNQAMYLRCSKEEPFFYLSVFVNFGFPIVLLCFLSVNSSIYSVLISFLFLHLIELVWGERIFRKIRVLEKVYSTDKSSVM